ncbi:hypothetical protein ITP53_36205 [Nonomuraea sp. K274]|uniref:Uncharacterized protein n=1 Tax=Nonomuraea cypriaca TaxID=1187855 RepID=A0A931F4E7_9ACTN|nr:DUF6492 family protein [Nonomuraea cypriaca]MBF8191061.1 hypothetical protein [Nonomuraea cypriaca]
MSALAVVTPTYAPDAELFDHLHRSVLAHTSEDTVHHVVVPPADHRLFARYSGPRCRIWTYAEILPRRLIRAPLAGVWIDPRRPWPPLRGWVAQQAAKVAVAARLDAKVVLVADSDVVLVREVNPDLFIRDGHVCMFRVDDGVHEQMTDHVTWHRVARELLGLPGPAPLPLPDYVSSLASWDPAVVRGMQQAIIEATGRDWLTAFTSYLQVSEFIVYGVFVDEVLGISPPVNTAICHSRWDRTPLDHAGAIAFADRLPPDAVGMMISAKSRTPMGARRAAIERCSRITGPDGSHP